MITVLDIYIFCLHGALWWKRRIWWRKLFFFITAFLLGSIIAAVSPAVIVPCLFRLRAKGYGVSKGIPTLVLAVSGVDDAASVAVFGIVSSLMFSTSSMTMNIIQVRVNDIYELRGSQLLVVVQRTCKLLEDWSTTVSIM